MTCGSRMIAVVQSELTRELAVPQQGIRRPRRPPSQHGHNCQAEAIDWYSRTPDRLRVALVSSIPEGVEDINALAKRAVDELMAPGWRVEAISRTGIPLKLPCSCPV